MTEASATTPDKPSEARLLLAVYKQHGQALYGYPHVQANRRYVLVFAPGTDPQAPPPYYQTQKRLMLVEAWPVDAQGQVVLWARKQLASCHV